MRIRLLMLFLCAFSFAFAQNDLSHSRQTSRFTYIYKINEKETRTLALSNMEKVSEKYLHELVDSFELTEPVLPPGNYLYVFAARNRLHFELKNIGDISCKIINNNHDLILAFHSANGNFIENASVEVNGKKIPYDPSSHSYRINKYKRSGYVLLDYNKALYVFKLQPSRFRYYPLWKRVVTGFPLGYAVNPIRNWIRNRRSGSYHDDFFYRTGYERRFRGFLVFSKPEYKPGDTVRFKAFVANNARRPVNKALLVRLCDEDLITDTILTTLKPYRPGCYEYSFVLSEALDLDLDYQHLITLEETSSRKYEDEEQAHKRKVLMRGKYDYEEYDLRSIHFSARADKQKNNRGNEVAILLKATDENDLPVMDGRIQLLVKPRDYGTSFQSPKVFLPDTLWYHEQPMDAFGETRIILPDSIFPEASFEYDVKCRFLNSDNELHEQNLNLSFISRESLIVIRQDEDSLHVENLVKGLPVAVRAEIHGYSSNKDTIFRTTAQLPYTLHIDPFVKAYEVKTAEDSAGFSPGGAGAVAAIATRTKDSIYIQLSNPRGLDVWYTLFAGNKLVARGKEQYLVYKDRTRTRKNYFISLQYVYGDKVYSDNYTVPYHNKSLAIAVDQPQFIYPGQKTEIGILVKDADGKPVPGADITAYAFTKKFEGVRAPFVPYLGKIYPGRKRFPDFQLDESLETTALRLMNWDRWSREMRLDTIEYYKFLHPERLYVNVEPAPDTLTQVAPFVVKDGAIIPVHQLYIDGVPFYFSQAQQLQRYSFAVSPGLHQLKLRTPGTMIILDSFWIGKGAKTFVSINADTSNKRVQIQKMPDTLTAYEKALWSKYMILVENYYPGYLSYIKQQRNYYLFNPDQMYRGSVLVGPIPGQMADLVVRDNFVQNFEAEGGYYYQISPGLIKQKQLPAAYALPKNLPAEKREEFRDYVLTEKEIDSIWQFYLDHRAANTDLFQNLPMSSAGNGRLMINVTDPKNPFIRNILVFRYDDPDFLRLYKGSERRLGYLRPGNYRIFFLLKGDDYFLMENVSVQKDGLNYYETGNLVPKPKDSTSARIWKLISGYPRLNTDDFESIKESFNQSYLDLSSFTQLASGTVIDRDGHPVYAATVTIKGTRQGVITNALGNFQIKVPSGATLVISSVGYESRQLSADFAGNSLITLGKASAALEEVVVVGYGVTSRRKELTASVAVIQGDVLNGRVAGLTVTSSQSLRIRGTASVTGNSSPLIIIDGLPATQQALDELSDGDIESISAFKPNAEESRIYGVAANNGLVVIVTKKAAKRAAQENPEGLPQPSLRRHFNDAAYWQPRLKTNAEGKASFTVQFPDDITNWRSFVIAEGSNRRSGFTESTIKSFKAISASLFLPQFAVIGDSVTIIGKTLNYLPDSLVANRSFYVDNNLLSRRQINVKNSWVDSFGISVVGIDSLRLRYLIEKSDGYSDGEERNIPVFPQGVLETSGFFAALNGDTSFTLPARTDTARLTIYAEASLFPVWEDEIEKIRNYEYLCNEQIASKIKALLVQKKIDGYFKRPFKGDKEVKDLLAKLDQNKASSGLWGWWSNTETSAWISLHVIEAMTSAASMGYTVALNKDLITDYLIYNLENYRGIDKISSLHLLLQLGAKVDYQKYADSLQKYAWRLDTYEKMRLAELRQKTGQPFNLDSLRAQAHHTLMGNIYWGEEDYHFFDNSIQITLAMYRLMKAQGGNEKTLEQIRNYFLEKRRSGQWRNTYESSLILETILPDLLVNDSMPQASTLVLSGSSPQTITQFPFRMEIDGGNELKVSKSGKLPVYFTAYEQHWNGAPKKVDSSFSVDTWFEAEGRKTDQLKTGQPVIMHVKVKVKGDADYVMIEAPIPAGCSYRDKSQSPYYGEVHREYFRNKVSIFCTSLKQGEYVFSVSLLPRYTGQFNLNPAKAEMMYFPVFYGREAMKIVRSY